MRRIIVSMCILLALASAACNAAPDFQLKPVYLLGEDKIYFEATCLAETAPQTVWAELRDEDGMNTLRRTEMRFGEAGKTASVTWRVDDLTPGQYRTMILESNGREVFKMAHMQIPTKPQWLGSGRGQFDDNWVPEPWTPLQVSAADDLTVSCWGRHYTMNSAGLASVISQDSELLASPMVWKASVDGRDAVWQPKPVVVTDKARGAVEFSSEQTAAGVRLKCSGRMEFDGFVKLDYTLEATGTPVTIDSLTFEVPYVSKFAALFHHFPKVPVWYGGVKVDKMNSGSVKPEGLSSVFVPHVWLGNEDKGLQWICESDEYWKPADENKAVEVVPGTGSTVLRLNIIGKPVLLDSPRHYTFAFHASPIKPMPKDRYTWHYTHMAGCFDIINSADRMKEANVTCVDTLTWTEFWAYPGVATRENVDLLYKTVDTVKAKDIDMMVYYAFLLSDVAPEYDLLATECLVTDKNAYKCPGWMNDTTFAVCQNSIWADRMLEGIYQTTRRFDLDGVYSDSMSCIGDCDNALHGCGYTAEDGTRKPTVEVFAVRDFMKRVYRILEQEGKAKGKNLKFVGHISANVTLPTLSFCSVYLDTEHLTPIPRPFRLPLDVFRAEFMGRNFGVPAQSMSYHWFSPNGMTEDEMLALSLIHDTEMPWATKHDEVWTLPMAPVWKAWDEFGMQGVEFLPYWDDWGWKAPEDVKVSAYIKPDKSEMLVVAANVGETEVKGEISLGRRVTAATDSFSGDVVLTQGQAILDSFPAWQPKMYRVRLAE